MPVGVAAAPSQIVAGWLESADLSHHAAAFGGVSPDEFKGLLLQDYGKYGITDMADKQRLFRLIKLVGTLGPSASLPASAQPSNTPSSMAINPNSVVELDGEMIDNNAALLNLEDHDEDLLPEVTPPPFLQSRPFAKHESISKARFQLAAFTVTRIRGLALQDESQGGWT